MFGRFGPQIELLLFGMVCLGLGSLLSVALVVGVVWAAASREWQALAELLVGFLFVLWGPVIGIKWLVQRRQERGEGS